VIRSVFTCTVILLSSAEPVLANSEFAVGFQKIEVISTQANTRFPMAVVYPTHVSSASVRFGPFEMELSIGGVFAEGIFPLVIISHGSGGSSLGHRSIAFALVKRGFIVAMPLHPEDNYKDNSAEGTVKNWVNRPLHIKSSIDTLLSNADLSTSIDSTKIAVVGHSAGGYTALAIAGGVANTGHLIERCKSDPQLTEPFCGLVKDHKMISVEIENKRDERVKAIVLMAPVGILFSSEDSLAQVSIPTLLLRAEKDNELTEPHESEVIARNFRDKNDLTYQTIENAGHYSFITPFPGAIKSDLGMVAEDPAGFDRVAFHQTLGTKIADYLERVLH
jgi:predicted dienelactone hydrolase